MRRLLLIVLAAVVGCGQPAAPPGPKDQAAGDKPDPARPKDQTPLDALSLFQRAEVDRARLQARQVEAAVLTYFLRHQEYPADLTILTQPDPENNNKAYLEAKDLLDPWGKPFQIDPAGPHNKGAKPDIFTIPPDAREPVGNWK
jgi:hypothetical protein